MQYIDRALFNPAVAQLTINNNLLLYDVPPACFGLDMAIIGEVLNIFNRLCHFYVPLFETSLRMAMSRRKHVGDTL
jgi:ABC-type histidine transport system ATPase subunit